MTAPATRPHYRFWPKRVPHTITLPDTSLWTNLDISALRFPDKTALSFFGRTRTFAQLRDETLRLAGWLQRVAGVQRGDRVMLMMQNSPQFIIAYYAVLRADAVVVPVNPMNRADEIGHYITDPQARVALCGAELADQVVQANARLADGERLTHLVVTRYGDALPAAGSAADAPPAAWRDWLYADPPLPAYATRWPDALAAGHAPGPHAARADDLAVLPYTSGTTGLPKGCMHTHRTIMHNVVGGQVWLNASADTVSLAVVPMFHITGMLYSMHLPLYLGGHAVIMPRWDRELAGALISRHKVTSWTMIPTMIIDLLASPNVASFDLSSLQHIGGGGAAMPQAVAEKLLERFGLRFIEGYGLTETAAPSHTNPPDAAKLQCLGIPYLGTDARVVHPDTLAELPPGEVGEIIICGPQVFKGYWQRPEATEAAFVEFEGKRFFRSGDLGRTDDDGYFFITDRLKRMINASGFKVWPAEVETMLFKHPAVQEACIIAAHDAYRGETVKAVVVLREAFKGTTSADDIIAWSREHMAAYKVPRLVEFVDVLPKSGSGKVMWRLLQEKEQAAAT
ncbi:MAG: long-chain fatty acid--CoA ligase [Betaproteobacteria bacterium]|nr:long-chain fatty acid--CoA ligase [Betaproteobacteria bacterium]